MATTISDTEALDRIGELLRQVAETGEPVFVEWGGKAQVAIVPARSGSELQGRTRDARPEPIASSEAPMDLSAWLAEVDRVREMIRQEIGDRPLPDLDELIDGGRDERDDAIIAALYRR